MSLNENGVSLNAQGRAQSQSVVGQDMNLFVFDAFEYDDPNIVEYPVLRMKEPWSLEVPAIVSGRLDQLAAYLDRSMKQQGKNQDENEWALSQIKVGQNEIDIRVTGNLETITEQGETIDGHSTAFINLGIDPAGSSITIGADKVLIGGATHPTSNILDTFMTIDNITKRLTIDGDIYADNGNFSGDISGSTGTFDNVDVRSTTYATQLFSGKINFGYSPDSGSNYFFDADIRHEAGIAGGIVYTASSHDLIGNTFITGELDVSEISTFNKAGVFNDKLINTNLVSFQYGRKLHYHFANTKNDVYDLLNKQLAYNNDGFNNFAAIIFGVKESGSNNDYYIAIAHYANSSSGSNIIRVELMNAPIAAFTVTDGDSATITYNQYLL